MSQVVFTAYVRPEPKGSMKYVGHRQGRPIVVSQNRRLKGLQEVVAWNASAALVGAGLEAPMAGKHIPVEVDITFTFLRPKSDAKRKHMTVKPDLDKLMRGVLDACTGILWQDDAQVVAAHLYKDYGTEEKVHISARTVK